jgi:hypothetical protein
MPLFYGSPGEGLAYLEADGESWAAGYAAAVYAAAVKRRDEDDAAAEGPAP